MIHQSRKLSTEQRHDLALLRLSCQAVDGNTIPIYPELLASERMYAANFLYYDQGHIIGFLAVFFFYEQAVEISLLIHPDWRKKGIARQLFKASLPLLEQEAVASVYFSRPQGLPSAALKACGLGYSSSEYRLSLTDKKTALAATTLVIRQANLADLEALCALDEACFGPDLDNEVQLKTLVQAPNYVLLLGEMAGCVLAKVHLCIQDDALILSNLAVMPTAQRQGYGRALIEASIARMSALQKTKLSLDVESKNARALNLYLQCGFQIENACDYFIIDFLKLKTSCRDKNG